MPHTHTRTHEYARVFARHTTTQLSTYAYAHALTCNRALTCQHIDQSEPQQVCANETPSTITAFRADRSPPKHKATNLMQCNAGKRGAHER